MGKGCKTPSMRKRLAHAVWPRMNNMDGIPLCERSKSAGVRTLWSASMIRGAAARSDAVGCSIELGGRPTGRNTHLRSSNSLRLSVSPEPRYPSSCTADSGARISDGDL
jgi:hypothetical protein